MEYPAESDFVEIDQFSVNFTDLSPVAVWDANFFQFVNQPTHEILKQLYFTSRSCNSSNIGIFDPTPNESAMNAKKKIFRQKSSFSEHLAKTEANILGKGVLPNKYC